MDGIINAPFIDFLPNGSQKFPKTIVGDKISVEKRILELPRLRPQRLHYISNYYITIRLDDTQEILIFLHVQAPFKPETQFPYNQY